MGKYGEHWTIVDNIQKATNACTFMFFVNRNYETSKTRIYFVVVFKSNSSKKEKQHILVCVF